MKYEEILRWRQEVYDATMLGLQARSNSSQVSYPSSASVKPREQNTRQDSWTSGDPIGAALQAPVIQKDCKHCRYRSMDSYTFLKLCMHLD